VSVNEVAKDLAQVRIEPGLWERSTAVTAVNAEAAPRDLLARMRKRRSTSRHCISPEQAAAPATHFMASREGARCVSRSFSMRDGLMSGEMACTDADSSGQWTARLQGRYTAGDYDFEMIMEMPNPWDPGQILITSRTAGRRLGACPPAEPAEGGVRK
jgi:hypothetical protein